MKYVDKVVIGSSLFSSFLAVYGGHMTSELSMPDKKRVDVTIVTGYSEIETWFSWNGLLEKGNKRQLKCADLNRYTFSLLNIEEKVYLF